MGSVRSRLARKLTIVSEDQAQSFDAGLSVERIMNETESQFPVQKKLQRRTLLGFATATLGGAFVASRIKDRNPVEAQRSAPSFGDAGTAMASPSDSESTIATTSTPSADDAMQTVESLSSQPVIVGPAMDTPLVVKWRAHDVRSPFYPPVLFDGRIYIAQNSAFITVVDSASGALIWSEQVAAWDQVTPPVVVGETMYFSSNDRSGSTIQAINKDTLQELWSFTPPRAGVTPVTVHDDVLYVGADSATHALSLVAGEVLWKTVDYSISSSRPVWCEGKIFSSGDYGNIQAMDANTGELIWQVHLGATTTELVEVGAPLVADGRVFIWASNAYHALDAVDGRVLWQRTIGDRLSSFSVVNNTVYGAVDDTFHAFSADTGSTLWEFSSGMEYLVSNHTVADGVAYVTGKNVYALDAVTGRELWRHPVGETDMLHSTHIVVGDGRIFSNFEQSTLVAIGNLEPTVLQIDVPLRGAPSHTAIERGSASAGDEIDSVGARDSRSGLDWIQVTIGDVTGWIPLEAIDISTLPPEGEIEYVYVP